MMMCILELVLLFHHARAGHSYESSFLFMSARAQELLRFVRGVGLIAEQAVLLQRPAVRGVQLRQAPPPATTESNAARTQEMSFGERHSADTGFRIELSVTAGPTRNVVPEDTAQEASPAPLIDVTPAAAATEELTGKNLLSPPEIDPASNAQPDRQLTESKHIPSGPIARAFGFGNLGLQLAMSSLQKNIANVGASEDERARNNEQATEANAKEIADALRTMRGAALKIGQWMSLQEESVLPPPLAAALESARTGAYTMPQEQLHGVLAEELGADWREQFLEFSDEPLAAASIGQVHRAVTKDGQKVVLKVQYPGVADSIHSDLNNLQRLLLFSAMIPKGVYLEKVIATGRSELLLECDYRWEYEQQAQYKTYVESEPAFGGTFLVPAVIDHLSTSRVLTSHLAPGMPFESVMELPQEVRNSICTRLLRLTLTELFKWRYMQTDPNMGNYLYDAQSDRIVLLDFGASRSYAAKFTDGYMGIVWSAAQKDEQGIWDASLALKFVTGHESPRMRDAHIKSGLIMGEPFASEGVFNFGASDIMLRLRDHAKVFLTDRLTAPPVEAYSLQRKLAGIYLTCIKLGGEVRGRELLLQVREEIEASHP